MDEETVEVKVGDRVKAWKKVYYKDYNLEGLVIQTIHDRVHGLSAKIQADDGHTDWYLCRNDLLNRFTVIERGVAVG